MRGATKRFGAVLALDHVDLEVRAGEVLALLGDNGAGKSTLIKCLSGVHRLDEGVIELDGEPVEMHSPADARAHGIETVYQDLALFDNLGPAANFYAGRELPARAGCRAGCASCAAGEMASATREVLARLQVGAARLDGVGGADVRRPATGGRRGAGGGVRLARRDPRRADGGARRARVAHACSTSSCACATTGHAVIVISHAMDHVIEVADRAVVMRRGRVVGEVVPTRRTARRSSP